MSGGFNPAHFIFEGNEIMPAKKPVAKKPVAKKLVSKEKSFDAIIKNIEKSLKSNPNDPIIEKAPTIKDFSSIPVISFGYPEVDEASFCGGVPQGKLIEIFGPESGGKSFLSLKLIASAQKSGMKCCLVDAENSYDPLWADGHGVDTTDLYIIRKALSAQKILNAVDKLCASGAFGLIVIDSTAALIPQKILDGEIGDATVAELARVMSDACRKIVANCANTNTTCVFLNQIREKVGIMFGSPETTPGGRALKFYSHQRIKVTPGKKVKVEENGKPIVIARQSWVQFVKNKVARPFGEGVIEIIFDHTARNPIVKLCKAAKDYKVISVREGTFRIHKNLFEGSKKNVDTETKTTVELADYLVQEGLVEKVLETYIENYVDENGNEDKIDQDILALRDDPSLIVSPMDGATVDIEQDNAPEISKEEIIDELDTNIDDEDDEL
jgi:recombination protein RecA